MNAFTPWPWSESLGGVPVDDGQHYRIRRILFGMVGDRCRELGLTEGERVRCLERDHDGVEVQLSDGAVRTLDLTYAWFVEVEPAEDWQGRASSPS